MKYHVQYGDLAEDISAGNPMQACLKMLKIYAHPDRWVDDFPNLFTIWWNNDERCEEFSTAEILALQILNNQFKEEGIVV